MATDTKIQGDQQCEKTWCKCGGVIRTPYSAEPRPGGPFSNQVGTSNYVGNNLPPGWKRVYV